MPSIVNMQENRATDIGNMHKKLGKDRAWFQRHPREQTDRQTHTHRQTYSSQYFANAPTGKVIKHMPLAMGSKGTKALVAVQMDQALEETQSTKANTEYYAPDLILSNVSTKL